MSGFIVDDRAPSLVTPCFGTGWWKRLSATAVAAAANPDFGMLGVAKVRAMVPAMADPQ
jgi:hypothetical protein